MKKILIFILLVISISVFAKTNQIISAKLKNFMTNHPSEFVQINIFFTNQFDYSTLKDIDKTQSKALYRKQIYNRLKNFSINSQANVRDYLGYLQSNGDVENFITIPINNVLNCKIRADKIKELEQFKNIAFIQRDEIQKVVEKPKNEFYDNSKEITWNVLKVNADDVWQMGYTGEDVLVAIIDTGVNYNHHDLQDHMWQDNDYPNHGYDFINNDNNPMDDMGHGTHCAGTIAGDGTSGSQTGVAPDATIMALKVLRSDGTGSESAVWQAMDFALQHNADVISMSLGWQHSWGVDRTAWRNATVSLLEANIPAAIAAGNEGDSQYQYPIPDNIRTPGDCPPPWLHPDQTLIGGTSAVIAVGATNSNDNVAGFSGRGPVDWSNVSPFFDYPYQPEMGLIRPDVVAPGVNIKSLDYSSNTGYVSGWDGTSMATPCVAGTIALMLSKNHILTPAQIDQILETTAVHLASNKNNVSGSGRIDALAAVNATPNPTSPPADVVAPVPENNSTNVMTGIQFQWQNGYGGIPDYYKFYLGTDNPPTNIVNGDMVDTTFYSYSNSLDFGTQYYWKVEAYNDYGNSDGTVWNFSTISEPDEDFETGNFENFDWEFTGSANWTIDSLNAISGVYCAKSGRIYNNQYTTMQITMDVAEDSEILFWKKVSSEENYDKLKFSIDNSVIAQWSGESDWSQEVFPVSEGTHTFKWKYIKLNGGDAGEDCAWIDYIVFPPTGTNPPAEMVVNPTEFNINLPEGNSLSDTLFIQNIGGQNLVYSLSIEYQSGQNWLSISQNAGTVLPNMQDTISVLFLASTLPVGTYNANLIIDDNREETLIPVTLSIENVYSSNTDITQSTLNLQNFPNPFNPSTTISFYLADKQRVSLNIYNIKGQIIKKLLHGDLNEGNHKIVWKGKDENNQDVKSGIYIFKLNIGKKIFYKKSLLLK